MNSRRIELSGIRLPDGQKPLQEGEQAFGLKVFRGAESEGLDDYGGFHLTESMTPGYSQLDPVGQSFGEQLPLDNPYQIIGPTGLAARPGGDDDGGNLLLGVRGDEFPQ